MKRKFILLSLLLSFLFSYGQNKEELLYRLPSVDSLLHLYESHKIPERDSIYFERHNSGYFSDHNNLDKISELQGEISLLVQSGLELELVIERLYDIAKRARETKDYSAEMSSYYFLTEKYTSTQQYVELCNMAAFIIDRTEELNRDFPAWRGMMHDAAQIYYKYNQEDKAIGIYKKCIGNPPLNPDIDYKNVEFKVNNGFGIYYATNNMLDSAYYYYSQILHSSHLYSRQLIHQSIALSNIGSVLRIKKQYNEALRCYRASLDLAYYDPNESAFVQGIYTNMGRCYLGMNDVAKTKQMIDTAGMYSPRWSFTQRAIALYELKNKYYTAVSQPQAAFNALDSLRHYLQQQDRETNERYLLLAQQEKIKGDLEINKIHLKEYKRGFICGGIVLAVITAFMVYIMVLYRKKRNAYQKLVEKNITLAHIDCHRIVEKQCAETDCAEDSIDYCDIIGKVKNYIITEKNFRDCELSITKISKDLNINRSYISKTINKMTGENFKFYVNTIRINEAILLLNNPDTDVKSMDELAEATGFTGRSTFYANFKKITGLTPFEFKQSMRK